MNIYHISWVQSGWDGDSGFGLNAVVVANTFEEAINEIGLDAEYNHEIKCQSIGVADDRFEEILIFAHERL